MSAQKLPEIKNAFDALRDEIRKLRKYEDNKLLAPVYIQYYMQEGEYRYSDYVEQITDDTGDGGIDAVVMQNEDQTDQLLLIQAKHVPSFSKEEALNAAQKIKNTIELWKNGQQEGLNRKIKRILAAAMDVFDEEDEPAIEMAIVTTASPSLKEKSKIRKALSDDPDLENYSPKIVFGDELVEKIKAIQTPKFKVDLGEIKISRQSGQLSYSLAGEEKCIIVSISAKSLKSLYNQFCENGLFGQNLREYIQNRKVDSALVKSIQKKPDYFWMLNNGITIGCNEYSVDGNRLRLSGFSIINGAQTTTKIGKTDFASDFYLPCKVIQESAEEELDTYAEAANAQKPIKDRDLKANSDEQRQLKQRFENNSPPVHIEIKRGVKKFTSAQRKKLDLRDWQQINNHEYGKLVLAFHRQKPWISYGYPGRIFSSDDIYQETFRRSYYLETDIDILRIHDVYLSWKDKIIEKWESQKRFEMSSANHEEIVKFGKFALIANLRLIICYSSIKQAISERKLETWEDVITCQELKGRLLSDDSGSIDLSEICSEKIENFLDTLLEVHGELIESSGKSPQQMYKDKEFYHKLSRVIVDRLGRKTELQFAYKNVGDVFSSV